MRKAIWLGALVLILVFLAGCGGRPGSPALPEQQIPAPVEPAEGDQEQASGDSNQAGDSAGRVIISDNPVHTDTGRLLDDLDKEIGELLRILDSMDTISEQDIPLNGE
jgi:predicted small lipoprotein YifL